MAFEETGYYGLIMKLAKSILACISMLRAVYYSEYSALIASQPTGTSKSGIMMKTFLEKFS